MTSRMVDTHLMHISRLEEKFGATSQEVATALNTLAGLICKYEEPADSVPYFNRYLAIREALHGPGAILGDLDGWINQSNPVGFWVREPFILKRLEIKTALFGQIDSRVADECDELASTYFHLKRFPAARPLLERSLTIKEKIHGGYSPEVAASLERLVEASLRTGDLKAADQYLKRCTEVTAFVCGPESKELAERFISLSTAYVFAGKSQRGGVKRDLVRRALSMFGKGLSITEQIFGPDSFETQKALEAMIHACLECDEFWNAEPLLQRLLSITERTYGNDAAALLWILIELGLGYALKESDSADAFVERSFEVMKSLLECKRPTYQHTIANLPGRKDVLVTWGNPGLLEKLLRATERVHSNTRRRWGASR